MKKMTIDFPEWVQYQTGEGEGKEEEEEEEEKGTTQMQQDGQPVLMK